MVSREFDEEFTPNLIAIQNFNSRNLLADHIKDQHAFLRR